jgi:hypothetical protein
MKEFANGLHLLGPFNRLGIINDKEEIVILFAMQAQQHIPGNLLHDRRAFPVATPQKFPVVRPMGRSPEQLAQTVYTYLMAYRQGHCQCPEMRPGFIIEFTSQRFEEFLQFFRDSTDLKHTVSPEITFCLHGCYRQKRPFCFEYC